MSMLTDAGIIFSSYLALGRTGAIASSLLLHEDVLITFTVALALDFFQIPVYGVILDTSSRTTSIGRKFDSFLNKKRQLWRERMAADGFWGWLARMQPLAVMTVAIIPIRGCGIISACVLCFMLGFSRAYGTFLIMAGSLVGALATLGILYEPMRFFNG
ncbi:MAG: small multi-drug export protein [Thermodesulfobacteriota bacterium]